MKIRLFVPLLCCLLFVSVGCSGDPKPTEKNKKEKIEKVDSGEEEEPIADEAVEKPAEEAVEKIAEKPVEKAIEKVVEKAIEKVVEKAIEKVAEKAIEKVAEKAIEKVAEKAIEKVAEKAIEKVAEKTIEKAVEKTKEKVAEKVKEKITEKPIEKIAEKPMGDAGAERVADTPKEKPPVEMKPEKIVEQVSRNTPDPTSAALIKKIRGLKTGSLKDVAVTYLKAKIGSDPAGFFVQATKIGPALFIAVDPAKTTPALKVGDIVSFNVTKVPVRTQGRVQVNTITGLKVGGSGYLVKQFLLQDLSAKKDIVTALNSYESELLSLKGKITGDFLPAGTGFIAATFDTVGLKGSKILRLRVPNKTASKPSLAMALGLVKGCEFTLSTSVMWRFNTTAQPLLESKGAIKIISCPKSKLKLLRAVSLSTTKVQLTFSGLIDKQSVQTKGGQFTFSKGLISTAALVKGVNIEVTTTIQKSGVVYKVTAATSIKDQGQNGVESTSNTSTFQGFQQGAVVLINELHANLPCDLIELRVKQGGSLAGFSIHERNSRTPLVKFPAIAVKKNDLIIIHLNTKKCNPGSAKDETTAINQNPKSKYSANYDTAYDLYSKDSGLTSTDNVITLLNAAGKVVDAVFVTSKKSPARAASGTEKQAAIVAKAKQWKPASGAAPVKGYIDGDFHKHAVEGLKGTPSKSIQRKSNSDTHSKADWALVKATWGVKNVGQIDF